MIKIITYGQNCVWDLFLFDRFLNNRFIPFRGKIEWNQTCWDKYLFCLLVNQVCTHSWQGLAGAFCHLGFVVCYGKFPLFIILENLLEVSIAEDC